MAEPENLVLHLLQEMRARFDRLDAKMDSLATKVELELFGADMRSEIKSLRADVASDLAVAEKRTSEQIVGLRRAVVEYHSAVVGHGIQIGDLENRVQKLEAKIQG